MELKLYGPLLFVLVLAGCAAPPPINTLEEALERPNAYRPLVEGEIPYHVNLVYANAAWQQLEAAEVPGAPLIDTQSTLEPLFAISDFVTRGTGAGLTSFALSFGNSDVKGSYRQSMRNRGLELTADANTHYYLFDTREGTATPEDVDHAWDQAYKVFQAVHNRDGRCHVNFWTPELGYRRAQVRNVRGELKEVVFRCPHPVYPDGPYLPITIQAWGNPFDGIRALGAIQARCWVLLPKEQQNGFRDYRDCGEKLAARQRPYLPPTDLPLMELVTTPTPDDPTIFHVVGRFGDRVTVLPAPETTPEFRAFLASIPYTVED